MALVAFVWHELRAAEPRSSTFASSGTASSPAGVVFAVVLGFALYSSVFALPVFLQNLLGYSAWDTGKVILPGAIASAFTMAVMGRLGQRFDARHPDQHRRAAVPLVDVAHYHFTLDDRHARSPLADGPARGGARLHLRAADRRRRRRPRARCSSRRAPACSTCRASSAGASASRSRPRCSPASPSRAAEALLPHLSRVGARPRPEWLEQATAPAARRRRHAGRGAAEGPCPARTHAAPAGLDGRVREGLPDDGRHIRRCAPPLLLLRTGRFGVAGKR